MEQQINNKEVISEVSKLLNYPTEQTPELDTSKILLVADVNPLHSRRCNIVKGLTVTNSTGGTIYTTPTDKDFYLTSLALAFIKDVTSTSTGIAIEVIIDGATVQILHFPCLSLTVQSDGIAVSYPQPVRIDRGTAISLVNATNVANIAIRSSLTGFTVIP